MSREKLGSSIEGQEVNSAEVNKVQFTQAGSSSLFSIEDFARSLPDDSLREMLSNIKPLKRKDQHTREIEEANNMPIEPLIFKLYWVDRKSIRETAQIIDVRPRIAEGIMLKARIPRRDKSAARRIIFEDPHRKKEIVGKMHTREANNIRSASIAKWHKEHPVEGNRRIFAANEAKRKNAETREREGLGAYPKFALFRLHYIDGYSVAEISAKTGLKESKIRSLMEKHGVKNLDKRPEVEGKYIAVVNPLLHVFYKREAKLNPNQEHVIYRRYIEPEYNFPTLEEVGEELGVTGEAVRRVEKGAIKKLSSAARTKEQMQTEAKIKN